MTVLLLCALFPLTACGTKGSLKSPSQVEADAQKKERKAAKEKAKAEKEKEKTNSKDNQVQ